MKHRKRPKSPNRCWCKQYKHPGNKCRQTMKHLRASERRQAEASNEELKGQ